MERKIAFCYLNEKLVINEHIVIAFPSTNTNTSPTDDPPLITSADIT